jgi:glycosyltransferase involved in cell wall biosynthesis
MVGRRFAGEDHARQPNGASLVTRPANLRSPDVGECSSDDELPVSVVMPVYNVAPFIDAAIASILHQSHRNFEFLIRDDGSTDGTGELLDRWARRDSRIRVFRDGRQLGPAASSNWIVEQARHELVARMDGDDISHPERLRRQVEVLRSRADVSLVGTLFRTIDVDGGVIRGRDRSRLSEPSSLAPFAHGSIMYRRSAFVLAGGYRPACDFWEDQDFFLRISKCGRILVLPEPLFDYRFNFTSTRLVSDRERVERSVDLGLRCLDAFAETGDYENLLSEGPHHPVEPRAIMSIAHLELWAYRRPAVLARLFTRSRLDVSLTTVAVLLWAVWAWLNPPSLRLASRAWGWLRDARAGRQVRDGQIYEWPLSRLARRASAAVLQPLLGPTTSGGSANRPAASSPIAAGERRPPHHELLLQPGMFK